MFKRLSRDFIDLEKDKEQQRKLYLTCDMRAFIPYNLNEKTTCETIYNDNKDIIYKKISEIYTVTKNFNLEDFYFILINMKYKKKNEINDLIRIKMNKNHRIYHLFQNTNDNNLILCFLLLNKYSNEPRLIARNNLQKSNLNISSYDEKLIKNNYLSGKEGDILCQKDSIYMYNNENKKYVKLTATLTEKYLNIKLNDDVIIPIADITDIKYYSSVDSLFEKQVVNGFKPPFYFTIHKQNNNQFIFGVKNDKRLVIWKNKLTFAMDKFKIYMKHFKLDDEIFNLKKNIAMNEKNFIEISNDFNDILNSKEKSKIFYESFEDKRIVKLIKDIFLYEKLCKEKNYVDLVYKLYDIVNNIKGILMDENNKNYDIQKLRAGLLTNEKYKEYFDLYNKAKNIIEKQQLQNVINIELSPLLKENLFKDWHYYLDHLFLEPHFQKFKNSLNNYTNSQKKEKKYIQKYTSLLGFNFMNNYNMKEKGSVLRLDCE